MCSDKREDDEKVQEIGRKYSQLHYECNCGLNMDSAVPAKRKYLYTKLHGDTFQRS
jgi:hypothetical protein